MSAIGLEELREMAEKGNAEAQCELGHRYENGDETCARSWEEALKWYRKAADQGNAEAQCWLALWMFRRDTDLDEGVHLLSKAARQGNAEARLALGVCHLTGCVVERDYKLAAEYMADAADKGNLLCRMLVDVCGGNGLDDGKAYAAELERWLKENESCNPLCQYLLGLYYENLTGREDRYAEALRWYRTMAGSVPMCMHEACYPADVRGDEAEGEDAKAQYLRGVAYETGDGVERDYEAAASWYRKAAGKGLVDARLMMGECYYYGIGVRQDLREASRWYREAEGQYMAASLVCLCEDTSIVEEQFIMHGGLVGIEKNARLGHPSAMYDWGYLNEYGYVTENSMVESYTGAAERGDAEARYKLGCLYRDGKGVRKDQRLASMWFGKAEEHGFDVKRMGLEACLAEGDSVPRDRSEAVRWYRKAAEQGNADAQFNLAYCFENGYGVPQNSAVAARWYAKAAGQGHPNAMYRLGCLTPSDEAVKWLLKAARLGNADAQYELGISLHGQNPQEAATWMLKAAEQGHGDAQGEMAKRYETGDGVPQSDEEADRWFTKYAQKF